MTEKDQREASSVIDIFGLPLVSDLQLDIFISDNNKKVEERFCFLHTT